ncbi:ATP-binding protein [Mobiluncus mulieris]|uniref:ATP-binding protein n=2 Tax=Mobiluncus TaxID=2050 RepID=A0A7Y0Y4C9_9ACTO|nr:MULTISPECIES: ATP-binding protein [Mobiluncus]NMW43922.1 ATP-binding protein [Mobiluncus curtisii]NMW46635.1 ATP-binding protein [Mobiluncus curtisii]NMW65195.1 ATP-binding protein [Mobiluncus mulieris]NMW83756.1 ATP-binding protein [Mobiluncus curtisii]NMW86298.1 ATP-binding protein [Mobiluncus curtisii]
MATSALHRELGIPARTSLTFDVLSSLVSKRVREQADLDFKQKLYHPKNEKDKKELVKDVCAMANSGGGWIVCGIAEKDSAAAQVVGVDIDITTETDIHQMLENRIDPPVAIDIRVYQDASRDKNLVAIRVPDSADKPHLMKIGDSKDTRAFQVPIRKGPSTVWLDERSLRSFYRESFNLANHSEEQMNKRLDDLTAKAAEEFPGIALVLLLSPQEPLTGKLDKNYLVEAVKNIDLAKFSIGRGFSFLYNIQTPLNIGDRRYTGKQTSIRFHSFIEVDFDGTVAVAIQLAVDPPKARYLEDTWYTNLPDEATQNELEYAIIEAFNFATQLEKILNPASDSQLQVRIVAHKNNPIIIRKNEGSWTGSLLLPREESTPIKHFRTVSYTIQAGSTSKEEHEILTDIILEVVNQGGIETIHILQPLPELDETPTNETR